jgi:Flp pilus assembly secretin CpaC
MEGGHAGTSSGEHERGTRMKRHEYGRSSRILGILAVLAVSGTSNAGNLELRPGFQRILDHGSVTRISIGNPEIIEARALPQDGGVLVVGKKEGDTDLVIWEKEKRTAWEVAVRGKNSSLEETRAFVASQSRNRGLR